jgi:hypothetical protein
MFPGLIALELDGFDHLRVRIGWEMGGTDFQQLLAEGVREPALAVDCSAQDDAEKDVEELAEEERREHEAKDIHSAPHTYTMEPSIC